MFDVSLLSVISGLFFYFPFPISSVVVLLPNCLLLFPVIFLLMVHGPLSLAPKKILECVCVCVCVCVCLCLCVCVCVCVFSETSVPASALPKTTRR